MPIKGKSTKLSYKITSATVATAATISSFGTHMPNLTTSQTQPHAISASPITQGAMGIDERLVDAKLEAVEARTETKFAQLMGKIELLSEKIGSVSSDIGYLKTNIDNVNTNIGKVEAKTTNTRVIVISTVIGAFLATAGIVYTVASYSVAIADFVKSP